MRKALIVLTLLFTLVLGLTLVAADDTQPEPGSPEDNACNPGGVLYREANQDGCPSLWHWKAGWFLARFLSGDISRADFPKEFESVLPPLPKVEAAAALAVTTICHLYWGDNWCFSSDNTGFRDYGADGIPNEYFVTINGGACPPNPPHPYGYNFGTNWFWNAGIFTQSELEVSLGLLTTTCLYWP